MGMGFYLGVTENVLELAEVTVARACECAKWQWLYVFNQFYVIRISPQFQKIKTSCCTERAWGVRGGLGMAPEEVCE